ncbi:MAG: FtsQ-type POTRA domain-containing protein [Candidatus Eremiobacteraeota bacterium]|nr:FtsQ-type POTRA domain-containing protein [Candidatus Eremiobacteraeota bacterium]
MLCLKEVLGDKTYFSLEFLIMKSNSSTVTKTPKKRARHKRPSRSAMVVRKVFIISLFVLSQLLFYYSDFFKLRHVYVHGNTRVTQKTIIDTAKIPMEQNIVTLPLNEFCKRLYAIHWFSHVKVKWNVPGRVDIYVVERTPAILVRRMNKPSQWYACDDEGMVLQKASPREKKRYPLLVIEDEIKVGKKIPAEKIKTARKLDPWVPEEIKKNAIYYYVDERLEAIIFCRKNGRVFKIKLGKIENIEHKMKVLMALSNLIEDKGIKAEYFDVRFKEPVFKQVQVKSKTREND